MASFWDFPGRDRDEAVRQPPQQPPEPKSSFFGADSKLQPQAIPPQDLCVPLGTFDNIVAAPDFCAQNSFMPCMLDSSDSILATDAELLYDSMPALPNTLCWVRNNLSLSNTQLTLKNSLQSAGRKRAPKAPTISSKSWRRVERRIRELYVCDRKSIEDAESGFTAK
jgi:hypothetical protein